MSSTPIASCPRSSLGLAVMGVSTIAFSAVLNSGMTCLSAQPMEGDDYRLNWPVFALSVVFSFGQRFLAAQPAEEDFYGSGYG
jgi:hypothetical protein